MPEADVGVLDVAISGGEDGVLWTERGRCGVVGDVCVRMVMSGE